MALEKTWSETLPTDAPYKKKVTTTNPDGLEEDTQYLITAGSTETKLG